MINVQGLRDDIREKLNDANGVEWTDSDIYKAILGAEYFVANLRPDATSTYVNFQCAAGARQSLSGVTAPSVNRLLDIDRNGDASTVGDAITRTAKEELDRFEPSWQSVAPSASTPPTQFMFDEREPLAFYLNPPAPASHDIMLTYSAVPEDYGAVDANTVTTVREIHREALKHYALSLLFSDDTQGPSNQGKAQQHLQQASTLLGVNLEASRAQSPKNPQFKK